MKGIVLAGGSGIPTDLKGQSDITNSKIFPQSIDKHHPTTEQIGAFEWIETAGRDVLGFRD